MATIRVTDARSTLPTIIETAQAEAVFLEQRGRVQAVVVSSERYERLLEALEEFEDVEAFDEAVAEKGDNIPWGEVKSGLSQI